MSLFKINKKKNDEKNLSPINFWYLKNRRDTFMNTFLPVYVKMVCLEELKQTDFGQQLVHFRDRITKKDNNK